MADDRFKWWFVHECDANHHESEQLRLIKREIRARAQQKSDRRCIYSDHAFGYYTLLIEFPYWVRTREEAEEWFNCNERMECVLGPYDCTGQHFTIRHKIIFRECTRTWWCYHHCGIDC